MISNSKFERVVPKLLYNVIDNSRLKWFKKIQNRFDTGSSIYDTLAIFTNFAC